MPLRFSRRDFLVQTGALAGAAASGIRAHAATLNSPFRIAVINDEITQDFGRACEIALDRRGYRSGDCGHRSVASRPQTLPCVDMPDDGRAATHLTI